LNSQKIKTSHKLKKNFYERDLLIVAENLIGKIFVKRADNKFLSGKIVEVEAYAHQIDEASHSYKGITKRNEVMFGKGGFLYVYFTYGFHFCCNVVTEKKGIGSAVLIRAIEPIDGIEIMKKNRFGNRLLKKKYITNLTSGPGKVCQAFGITKEHNGTSLTGNEIFIVEGEKIDSKNIVKTKRVGIKKSTEFLWRFYIKDNPFVSKK